MFIFKTTNRFLNSVITFPISRSARIATDVWWTRRTGPPARPAGSGSASWSACPSQVAGMTRSRIVMQKFTFKDTFLTIISAIQPNMADYFGRIVNISKLNEEWCCFILFYKS